MQHVTVTEYDPRWEKLFEEEKRLIASILGDNAAEIYHIGSTAVHGLAAKPIIDVMPVVYSLPPWTKQRVRLNGQATSILANLA